MNEPTRRALRIGWLIAAAMAVVNGIAPACATTTVFFDASQTTNFVASGATTETVASAGYLFTCTRDKLFTGGVGLTNPIGRSIRVPWPQGLEAQAVTAGPNPSHARWIVTRQDTQPFAIESFSFRLLANTAGAGATLEVMPQQNGEDALPDPVMFNATGIYGNQFSYQPSSLSGFDTYVLSLYVDFAVVGLTVVDASPEPPLLAVTALGNGWLEIAWPADAAGFVLESAAELPAPIWTVVTNAVVQSGGLNTVQVEATGANRAYRLRK